MEEANRLAIERLQQEMEEIKTLLLRATQATQNDDEEPAQAPLPTQGIQHFKHMHLDPKLSSMMYALSKQCEKKGRSGSVTYLGLFSSGGRQSNWIQNAVNTDDLLALIDNKSAAAVLHCIGSNDRLSLLRALLRTPMNVATMVEACGFNTTGQVYHHLKPLIAADLVFEVEQGERGIYAVKSHRVQGIIMLLAGVADLIDPKYARGDWSEA